MRMAAQPVALGASAALPNRELLVADKAEGGDAWALISCNTLAAVS
jgi:hypothetical protein